jgi:hypothetical protein
MTAKANGKSGWTIDINSDPEKLEMVTDAAMKHVLKTMQRAIVVLTNTKDARRLQALQSCTQKLYRQASECFEKGKTMSISDDYQGKNLS